MNCVFSSKVRRLSKPDRLSAETFVRKFGQKKHLRVFGRDSVKLLKEAGFVVSVIDVGGKMNLPPHGKEIFTNAVSSILHETVRSFLHGTVNRILQDNAISPHVVS